MKNCKKKILGYKDGIIRRLYHDLKWIYSFFREYIGRIIAYIGVELIHVVVQFIITYKIGSIVDFAVGNDVVKVAKMGIIYVALIVLNALISIASNRFAAWNYNSMQTHLVKKLYYKIVKADWQQLTKYHSGDLITRLTNDAKTISGNANGFLTTIITNSLMIVGCILVILFKDASMILVVIVVAPIIFFTSKIFMNKIYECQSDIREIESKENSYHKESFHNIQAVKAFGLADVFYHRIEMLENERFTADMKSNYYSLLSWGVTYLGGIFSAVICIAWAFYRVSTDAMSLGGLTVVIMMAYRIAISGKTLLNLIPVSLQLAVSTERVKEILAIPNEMELDSPEFHQLAEAGVNNGISIKVDNMSFAYNDGGKIFEKVSLEANPGEIIALVGPSGEGKTTMLRILLGILTIDSGKVFASVDSENIARDLSTETRPLMAYVPQGNTMLSGTIAENMRLIAPEATDEEIVDALTQACAYDFVKKLPEGIYHNIGESGIGFSEGQNQRLAIARAILRKTPILLMDEATSALDVATERKVLSNIMKKDSKRTCILTTHRPSVLSTCDRVYRISDSQVRIIDGDEITQLMNEF